MKFRPVGGRNLIFNHEVPSGRGRNFIFKTEVPPGRGGGALENEVPDLGHGRVGCWGPCLDEVVGFVFGFIFLVLYVGGSGGVGPQQ